MNVPDAELRLCSLTLILPLGSKATPEVVNVSAVHPHKWYIIKFYDYCFEQNSQFYFYFLSPDGAGGIEFIHWVPMFYHRFIALPSLFVHFSISFRIEPLINSGKTVSGLWTPYGRKSGWTRSLVHDTRGFLSSWTFAPADFDIAWTTGAYACYLTNNSSGFKHNISQ